MRHRFVAVFAKNESLYWRILTKYKSSKLFWRILDDNKQSKPGNRGKKKARIFMRNSPSRLCLPHILILQTQLIPSRWVFCLQSPAYFDDFYQLNSTLSSQLRYFAEKLKNEASFESKQKTTRWRRLISPNLLCIIWQKRHNSVARAQLFEGRLVLNPGLNLTRVSFSFVQKHFLGQFYVIFIEHRIINLLTKRIKLNLLYKLSYLNSNFALTLGYLNPALNNPAQIYNIASIFTQFWDFVRQLKKFSMDTKFADFILHWSIVTLKFCKAYQEMVYCTGSNSPKQ